MRKLAMVVSYDGTDFNGFQIQPYGRTVQGELETAIRKLTGESLKIHCSGRTDAGVHAWGQVFHFQTESQIPLEKWCLALNSRLPRDIVVKEAREVPDDFHARRSAKRKTYRYSIQRSRIPDPFYRHTRVYHPTPLRIEAMREALAAFVGQHDFTSFTSVRSPVGSHVRTIFEAYLVVERLPMPGDDDAGVIHLYVTGSGFLYNMVRIIVGTLIQVGEGKRLPSDIPHILAGQNRKLAGPTAEPHGLTLCHVEYGNL